MNFKDKKRSTERVTRRPEIVLALNNEVTKIDRKEICGCNQTESGWRKEFNDLLNSLEEKETWLFKECEISLCRWWAGRWSEASHRSNLVPEGLLYIDKKKNTCEKGEPVLYTLKDGPKRGFVREELQIVPPGTELPPEGIHDHWFEKKID